MEKIEKLLNNIIKSRYYGRTKKNNITTGCKNELPSHQEQEKNNISSEKNIFIHSDYSEKKQINLQLFNLSCTYLYVHTSGFKTQWTPILKNWYPLL